MSRGQDIDRLMEELSRLEAVVSEHHRRQALMAVLTQRLEALDGPVGAGGSRGGALPMVAGLLAVAQVALAAMVVGTSISGDPSGEPVVGPPLVGPETTAVAETMDAVEEAKREREREEREAAAVVAAERAAKGLPEPEPEPAPEPERVLKVVYDAGFQSTSVQEFPYRDQRTTSASELRRISSYSCAPGTDEGGPEIWYSVQVPRRGVLSATIAESLKDGIDVDVHILHAPSGDACLSRGNAAASTSVGPGRYWVVLDTYVSGGVEKSGGYDLTISLD